ncbi:endolytic transglycosylase MltG [Streptomyces flavofungini]|uniref:Endolytic murein transglycosylase n=1 Tax=Streptomyces flavofungini TaxID=68200 RepID=A0ABS0X4B4_9ACTN|nr:endolytic transglycosylase MltG [Streptomyces flavofungini]MBJ3808016.1 endolytic transglycosylase MltG [Streptomyces flavofungini]GHC82957.1 membrane protein [Streptomyces flavofungini]
MTEYGRGPGSEPWHPEDPLYGDGGWGGQQADAASPYGGQEQYHPQQPHQQHPQQSHHQPHPQQGQYQQPHPQQAQHPQQQAPYGDWNTGQQQAYGHGQQGYDQQGYAPAQAQYGGGGQPGDGGWDTGQHGHVPYGGDPADPYGGQPGPYAEERPDYYGTPEAYPPPEPPGRRRPAPEPEPETDWDPGPDQGEHAFFADGADEDEDDSEAGRGGGRGDRRGRGGKKPKKRRSGCACLVVTLVFAGGLGGIGYFGYQFYQDRFGTAPDYSGDGTSSGVIVTIDKGSGGYDIGNKLKAAGVVKSVDAFVSAQGKNPDGQKIQAGVYNLKKQMSAASAVELMLSPKSRNNLIIPEGKRNAWVYQQIDERLELDKGTTKAVAHDEWKSLGLPKWASANMTSEVKDPLEGFLYPSSYPVAKGQKPKEVLRKMVAEATAKYDAMGVEAQASELGLKNPLQVVTVASLVQAEGKYKHDFEKVATVVYNRLKPGNTETYGLLDFDSTVNYMKGQSKLAIGSVDELRKLKDPYNTYKINGLPPGPIGNPGEVAIKSALKPATGNWYYFVSVSADETLFSETNEEHNRNREKYEQNLKEQKGQ